MIKPSLAVTAVLLSLAQFVAAPASQAGKELNEVDAALNDSYQRLVASVHDAKERTALVAAQRAWIKFRDANVDFFAVRYPESKGGLFYRIRLTTERTNYLDLVYHNSPESEPDGGKASGYE